MDLAERVVLITGVTGGLGGAVVREMAATGARLALTARREDALRAVGAETGLPDERLLLHVADLTRPDEVAGLQAALAARWGGADVLLHLMGGWRSGGRVAEVSDAQWDGLLDLNLRAGFLVSRAVLPYMAARRWGRIALVSARAAMQPGPNAVAYNVAKAGVVALAASIAADYRQQGVAAVALLPGTIDTPDNREQRPKADTSRWVSPEDLAATLHFLCTEAGGALNGSAVSAFGRT